MKIALCLSGQPRFVDEGYSQLYEHLLSRYSVDCFVHTWWSDDMSNKNMNTMGMSNPMNRSYVFKPDTIDKIVKYYHPKKIIAEPQIHFDMIEDVEYHQPNKTISVQSFLYSLKIANSIKSLYEQEHGFIYDMVIRCRTDIKIKTLQIDSLGDMSSIYTDSAGDTNDFPNDQLAISSSTNMNYYSQLYDHLIQYKNEGHTIFVGEHLLRYHIKKSNIPLVFSPHIKNDIFKTT